METGPIDRRTRKRSSALEARRDFYRARREGAAPLLVLAPILAGPVDDYRASRFLAETAAGRGLAWPGCQPILEGIAFAACIRCPVAAHRRCRCRRLYARSGFRWRRR